MIAADEDWKKKMKIKTKSTKFQSETTIFYNDFMMVFASIIIISHIVSI